MKRVKSPEVEDNTVVLATLVCASAAFDKYWKYKIEPVRISHPFVLHSNFNITKRLHNFFEKQMHT